MTGRALLLTLAAMLATACGSSGTPPPPAASSSTTTTAVRRTPSHRVVRLSAAVLVRSIARTRAVPRAHVHQRLTVASPQGTVSADVRSQLDFHTRTGTTVLTTGAGRRERVIFSHNRVWITDTAPGFTAALPPGRLWVASTVSELESIGAFSPLNSSLSILDVMRGITQLHLTGPGRATFAFSLARALARTPAGRRAALARTLHTNGRAVSETGSVTVDSSGVVRSLVVVLRGTGSSAGLTLTSALGVSDLGARIVAVPPAHPVALASLPRLIAALRGSATAA